MDSCVKDWEKHTKSKNSSITIEDYSFVSFHFPSMSYLNF